MRFLRYTFSQIWNQPYMQIWIFDNCISIFLWTLVILFFKSHWFQGYNSYDIFANLKCSYWSKPLISIRLVRSTTSLLIPLLLHYFLQIFLGATACILDRQMLNIWINNINMCVFLPLLFLLCWSIAQRLQMVRHRMLVVDMKKISKHRMALFMVWHWNW